MAIKLDDDNENWMVAVRERLLRKRGWKGTLKEWLDTMEQMGADPLSKDPPITSPPKKR